MLNETNKAPLVKYFAKCLSVTQPSTADKKTSKTTDCENPENKCVSVRSGYENVHVFIGLFLLGPWWITLKCSESQSTHYLTILSVSRNVSFTM